MDDKIEAWLDKALSFCDKADCVGLLAHLRTTPEGYRLVPVNPTEAMIGAAAAKWQERIRSRVAAGSIFSPAKDAQRRALIENYTAMLAASQESGALKEQSKC